MNTALHPVDHTAVAPLAKSCGLLLAWIVLTAFTASVDAQVFLTGSDGNFPPPSNAPISNAPPAAGVPTAAGAPFSEVLKFFNGDTLHGVLLSVAAGQPIRWQHPEVKQPIEFQPNSAAEVILASQPVTTLATGPDRVEVLLTNDDSLAGQLIALDKDTLILETGYAGQLKVRRVMIRSIRPRAGTSGATFSGPTGLEGWTQFDNNVSWTFRNGSLVSTGAGGIGRDVSLPDGARIDFDITWVQYLNFYFFFHADATQRGRLRNTYSLQFNGTQVSLQRQEQTRGPQIIGDVANVNALQRKNRCRVTLLVNKAEKGFALMIDGELVKQWTDQADDFGGSGTGIIFYSQGSPVKVRNIQIGAWDGRINTGSAAPSDKEDTIFFINNDKVSGQIETIANQQISFRTTYATMFIPLARAQRILLASASAERARRRNGDVLASFATGGCVTFELEKLDGTTVSGASENFGQATFQRGVFNRIRFHIYDERHKKDTDKDDEF